MAGRDPRWPPLLKGGQAASAGASVGITPAVGRLRDEPVQGVAPAAAASPSETQSGTGPGRSASGADEVHAGLCEQCQAVEHFDGSSQVLAAAFQVFLEAELG